MTSSSKAVKRTENTVFISYRRTNAMTARAVYQHLTYHGYDCFLDYQSIDSGAFDRIILNQIKARAHFVLILTPSALERCKDPHDWLRAEIEIALEHQRNIVPLMFDGFSYSSPGIKERLVGKLALLSNYNSVTVPAEYFEEAMTRLINRFLKIQVELILHPTPSEERETIEIRKAEIGTLQTVTEKQLTAVECFEKGFNAQTAEEKIHWYTESLRLNPQDAQAYYNRAMALYHQGLYDKAIQDYDMSLRYNPESAVTYNNRGNAKNGKGDYNGAIADYDDAINLNPKFAKAYANRGLAHNNQGDYVSAIEDYNYALILNPNDADTYNNRGIARDNQGDHEGGIDDCTQALLINPNHIVALGTRGSIYLRLQKYSMAIRDLELALKLDKNYSFARMCLKEAKALYKGDT